MWACIYAHSHPTHTHRMSLSSALQPAFSVHDTWEEKSYVSEFGFVSPFMLISQISTIYPIIRRTSSMRGHFSTFQSSVLDNTRMNTIMPLTLWLAPKIISEIPKCTHISSWYRSPSCTNASSEKLYHSILPSPMQENYQPWTFAIKPGMPGFRLCWARGKQ